MSSFLQISNSHVFVTFEDKLKKNPRGVFVFRNFAISICLYSMNNEKKLQKKYFSVKVGRLILFVQSYVFVYIFSMIVIQVGPGVKCRLAPV